MTGLSFSYSVGRAKAAASPDDAQAVVAEVMERLSRAILSAFLISPSMKGPADE